MRRPALVAALVAAVIALVVSAAMAAGNLRGPSSGPMMGSSQSMMGPGGVMGNSPGSMMGKGGGMMGNGAGSMMGGGTGMMGNDPGSMMGGGMMGSGQSMMGGGMMGSGQSMMGSVWLPGNGAAVAGIPAARARAASAAKPAGLHPGEVMRFDNGFYVELKDGANKPATEVVVDPRTGAVSTEPGPAMMWNTRFGMMGSGVGGAGAVDAAEARTIATSWLAANQPGTTIGSVDPYPGYFTLDLRRNGVVSGMMSVSSATGATWYHTWHGTFIEMEDS